VSSAPDAFVTWFRHSSPYINAHRKRTFVVLFGGEVVADPGFSNLIHDLALLNSLGVHLVLAHGARPQIEDRLRSVGTELRYVQSLRVTTDEAMPCVREAVGSVRMEIEAKLSMGLANSPMAGARMRVASGNFVTAKPLGVRDGIDYLHTGEVRRVDAVGIRAWLDVGAIVLLSSIGYSPTGEMFNLSAEEVGIAAARALRADKLLYLAEEPGPTDDSGELIRQLTPSETQQLLNERQDLTPVTRRHLEHALLAARAGVRRVHLLDRAMDGALIRELFTRDGVGTLVSSDTYESVRSATIDDVGGILELISPLEADGILVRRSRELLEMEIERFVVLERDGGIIGCAALYPYPDEACGELACVAVAPAYQGAVRADTLMQSVERQARRAGLARIFVLTTRTAHWFRERGFEAAKLDELPMARQALYNYQRNSRVFVKHLT
jgi:amino-acid N-acetyltransferase